LKKYKLSAFHLFALHDHISALNYTLKLGTNINCRTSIANSEFPGSTALHIAAANRKLEMVKYLIKQGIRIDE